MFYRQSVLAAGVLTPILALAGAPADNDIIEQIVVTAQKREAALQDVPFSVAAASETQIRNSGATNVIDLSRNFAGLTMTDLGPGQSQVAIRGISAGQIVRDQPGVKESVGVYLDESAISVSLFTPDLDLFDLERFEVLRGPQGTLFGAGSSGGTVRYITRQPQLGKSEGAVEVSGYTGTDTDVGYSAKGAINVPVGETTALRLVGYYNELAGFIDSVYPGREKREDVNSGEKYGARVAMLFQPSDTISITPRIVYQKLETDGYPRIDEWNILGNPYTTTQPAVTVGEREQVTQFREGISDEFTMADLTMEFGLGGLTLTSVSSYTDRDVVVLRDASQLTGSVTAQIDSTSPEVRLNSPLYDTTALKSWSQELRLASAGGSAFEWLVGAFYQDVQRDYGQNLPTPGYDAFLTAHGVTNPQRGAPPDTPFYSKVPYDFNQFAIFGEGTLHMNEQWSLTGGLRYYDFQEDRLLTFAGFFADQGYTEQPGSTSSDGFSPRVILSYTPSEDVLLTAQVARGFRLGGINDPLNVGLCQGTDLATYSGHPGFEDEKVLNYELGAKTTLADGRVTLNGAVFYSDIDDLQVIADAGSCSSRIIINAQAESVGAEIELAARASENWDFGISATYVNAEIKESQFNGDGEIVAGIRKGNRLPTSPEFQAAASVTYSVPFSASLEGFGNFTFQYVGSSFTQLADQETDANRNPPPAAGTPIGCVGCAGYPPFISYGNPTINSFTFNTELPSYELGNLRFGVRNDAWEAALFINNVWDERAFLSMDRERGTRARVGYLTNMPRTYGLQLRMNF